MRLFSVIYTLGFLVSLILVLLIIFLGGRLGEAIKQNLPDNTFFEIIYRIVRTFLKLLLLTVFFGLMYLVVPRRRASALSQLPGAVLSALGWLCYSWFYTFLRRPFRRKHPCLRKPDIHCAYYALAVCLYVYFLHRRRGKFHYFGRQSLGTGRRGYRVYYVKTNDEKMNIQPKKLNIYA